LEINDIITKDKPRVVKGTMKMVDAMAELRSSPGSVLIVRPESKSDTYGIVSTREIVFKGLAKGLDPHKTQVSQVMTKPVLILNNLHLDLRYVAMAMANAEVDHVLIFDGGEMVGGLSLNDVLIGAWRECSRKYLDALVSDVGGGC
jgi:signal-transduction protein with cAMP-binding, CBS, and nucleotidyltransferase domain